MHKDKQELCRFFVVPEGVPAWHGMLDVKTLELLKVNYNIIEPRQEGKQINE